MNDPLKDRLDALDRVGGFLIRCGLAAIALLVLLELVTLASVLFDFQLPAWLGS